MPYSIEWRGTNYVVRHFTGTVTGEEVVESTQEIINDIRFDQLHNILSDYSQVDHLDVSMKEATYLAHLIHAASKSNPSIRLAAIVTDEVGMALGSLVGFELDQLENRWEIEYFDSPLSAESWLKQARAS